MLFNCDNAAEDHLRFCPCLSNNIDIDTTKEEYIGELNEKLLEFNETINNTEINES
jgi:hypothetical protein